MTAKLFIKAISLFILGVVLVGMMIFIPAGTLDFDRGWLLMSILFIPMFLAGIAMMCKAPGLLEKRLKAKESQSEQSTVVKLSGLMFIAGFIVAGMGVRCGWYMLPNGVSICAAAIFLIAYLIYAEVLRENTYLSRTIEVHQGQTVISTGLYGIVRHPMYSATLLLFMSMPLVLGSVYSFIIFLAYPAIIIKRLKHEEDFLKRELAGYAEYMKKVRWRLIPFVW